MVRNSLLSFTALALMLAVTTVGADDAPQTSISRVGKFDGGDADGASMLTRTRNGVAYSLNTRELAPDVPYTNWWITFNNPEKCFKRCACGEADFDNPKVDIGVFWATGRISDAYGQAAFSAEVEYGELPGEADQVPFPDFDSPIKRGAEIHLVVRGHGPRIGDGVEQLTTFNGGCGEGEPNVCVDVQFAEHRSPSCKAKGKDDDD